MAWQEKRQHVVHNAFHRAWRTLGNKVRTEAECSCFIQWRDGRGWSLRSAGDDAQIGKKIYEMAQKMFLYIVDMCRELTFDLVDDWSVRTALTFKNLPSREMIEASDLLKTKRVDILTSDSLFAAWWRDIDIFHDCSPPHSPSRKQMVQRYALYRKQKRNVRKLDTNVHNVMYHRVWYSILNSITWKSSFNFMWSWSDLCYRVILFRNNTARTSCTWI